jgi:hypothetical protein
MFSTEYVGPKPVFFLRREVLSGSMLERIASISARTIASVAAAYDLRFVRMTVSPRAKETLGIIEREHAPEEHRAALRFPLAPGRGRWLSQVLEEVLPEPQYVTSLPRVPEGFTAADLMEWMTGGAAASA